MTDAGSTRTAAATDAHRNQCSEEPQESGSFASPFSTSTSNRRNSRSAQQSTSSPEAPGSPSFLRNNETALSGVCFSDFILSPNIHESICEDERVYETG